MDGKFKVEEIGKFSKCQNTCSVSQLCKIIYFSFVHQKQKIGSAIKSYALYYIMMQSFNPKGIPKWLEFYAKVNESNCAKWPKHLENFLVQVSFGIWV